MPEEHMPMQLYLIAQGAEAHHALLARGKRPEVLDSLGDGLAVEPHDDATDGLAVDFHIEEHLARHRRALGSCARRHEHEEDEAGGETRHGAKRRKVLVLIMSSYRIDRK